MKKLLLEVTHITGNEHCILEEDGTLVADAVVAALHKDQAVALSFRGVEMLTTPFIRALFLPLLQRFSSEQLNAQFQPIEASGGDMARIKFVVNDLKLRLRDPEAYDRARERALEMA